MRFTGRFEFEFLAPAVTHPTRRFVGRLLFGPPEFGVCDLLPERHSV
jgi:hypothetical protein